MTLGKVSRRVLRFSSVIYRFHVSVVTGMDIQFMKCHSGTKTYSYIGTTIKQTNMLVIKKTYFFKKKKTNQQNAQINFGLINLSLFNHSNMFRPPNRSHHQGVQNP